jgi:hypothetical protein
VTPPAEPDPRDSFAGDLQVGAFVVVSETPPYQYVPIKHIHPGPLGFGPTQEAGEDHGE